MDTKVNPRGVCTDKQDNMLQQQQSGEDADITKDVFRKMDEASEPLED